MSGSKGLNCLNLRNPKLRLNASYFISSYTVFNYKQQRFYFKYLNFMSQF